MFAALAAATLLAAGACQALAPHEVLVLVNANSAASKEVANHFVHLRGVPSANVVYLDVPDEALEPEARITREVFLDRIYTPARDAARERGIEDHVLAWVYSTDFPLRIETGSTPAISLQGATFLRDEPLPSAEEIKDGRYGSPLWAGPDQAGGAMLPTASLAVLKPVLGDRMPLPSMLLGVTGARGLTVAEVVACLERGAASDGTAPTGLVAFVTNDNVRSTCRAWQFPIAREALAARRNLEAAILPGYPTGRQGLAGLMTGTASVEPVHAVGSFAPGAMAEHLTSNAGMFHIPDQTKLTAWIRGGATASAGTVIEPYSIWTKFPSAMFYVHYASGLSMLEGFFQSVRCPLQLLIVGEPLATPWEARFSVSLQAVHPGTAPDGLIFSAGVTPPDARLAPSFRWLLDGRPMAAFDDQALVKLDASEIGPGAHALRVVARAGESVHHHASSARHFEVRGDERYVSLAGAEGAAPLSAEEPVELTVTAGGRPERVGVLQHNRMVAVARNTTSETFRIDAALLGLGPQRLQGFAEYRGPDARVLSMPVSISIARPARPAPPVLREEIAADGGRRIIVDPAPPEDARTVEWFEAWAPAEPARPFRLVDGTISPKEGHFALVPTAGARPALCIIGEDAFAGASMRAETKTVGGLADFNPALVFGYRDAEDFCFFGLWGHPSAWVMGEYRRGRITRHVVRGRPIAINRWYALTLRRASDGSWTGYVDGEPVCTWDPGRRGRGRMGLMTRDQFGLFRQVTLGLPVSENDEVRAEENKLTLSDSGALSGRRIVARWAGDDGAAGSLELP